MTKQHDYVQYCIICQTDLRDCKCKSPKTLRYKIQKATTAEEKDSWELKMEQEICKHCECSWEHCQCISDPKPVTKGKAMKITKSHIYCKCGRLLTETDCCVGCSLFKENCLCMSLHPKPKLNKNKLVKAVEITFSECLELMVKKNADYSPGADPFKNFRAVESMGMTVEQGIMVRLCDKFSRLQTLIQPKDVPGAVEDEKVTDTIIDAINYFAILKAWLGQ